MFFTYFGDNDELAADLNWNLTCFVVVLPLVGYGWLAYGRRERALDELSEGGPEGRASAGGASTRERKEPRNSRTGLSFLPLACLSLDVLLQALVWFAKPHGGPKVAMGCNAYFVVVNLVLIPTSPCPPNLVQPRR